MTKTYLVRWEIEVEAASPYDAAVHAFEIQQDIDTTATFFDVDDHENSETFKIDVRAAPPQEQPPGCV
jgi:hypothetical protein